MRTQSVRKRQYDRAIEAAEKAYDKTIAMAWRVYHRTDNEAYKKCLKAEAAARKAHNNG